MDSVSSRVTWSVALLCLVGTSSCSRDVPKRPPQCTDYACPVGTYPDEYRELSDSSEDYVNIIKGECRYACVAAQDCPDGWWPVITETCFTCATVLPSGENVGGDCDSDNWAYWYEDAPEDTGTEARPPSCSSRIVLESELEEPDDTRELATDLGAISGGLYVTGYMSITTSTYYCGDGDNTGTYGEVDWFRFTLNCQSDATFTLRGTSSTPSLFVLQNGEPVAAPAEPGESMSETIVEGLTGEVEVAVACWDAPSTNYWLEISF